MRRPAVRQAAYVVAGCLPLGVLAGVVWAALAPHVVLRTVPGGLTYEGDSLRSSFGAEGRFATVVLVAGVVTGVAAWLRTREDGLASLAGLVVGGVLASVIAWQVGHWLGPDDVPPDFASRPPGASADLPIDVKSRGMLLLWSMGSLLAYLALTVGFTRPERPSPPPPW